MQPKRKRPALRSPDQSFSTQMKSLAAKQNWAPITAVELFDYLKRRLDDDPAPAQEIPRRLGLDRRYDQLGPLTPSRFRPIRRHLPNRH